MSLRAGPATRYGRVALGDLGLVAAASAPGDSRRRRRLLLILTHLVSPRSSCRRRDPVWAHLAGWSGSPSADFPLPGVLGRFLILQACVAFNPGVAAPACSPGAGDRDRVLGVAQGEPGRVRRRRTIGSSPPG